MSARSYVHVYLKRGKLERKPCEVCGALEVEGHHPDYTKPLDVVWLCHRHHLEAEGREQRKEGRTMWKEVPNVR